MNTRRSSLLSAALLASVLILGRLLLAVGPTITPASLNTLGVPVTQNFNTLASTGASNTVPTGWGFDESGTSGAVNGLYTAGTGSGNAGDIYSFGATSNAERALGGLRSGTLTPIVGAAFTNNTGATITSLDIAYTGEQWRLGTTGRGSDRLDFQYSTNATSLISGTWVDVNTLDFSGPISVGTVGLLNGNAAANRTAISGTISGLTIPNGATFFIRWTDIDVTGSDDGLAIDDFSITAPVNPNPTGIGSAVPSSVDAGGNTLLKVTVTPGVSPVSTGLSVTVDLSAIGGSATQPFFDNATNGDAIAGDNVFSYLATVAVGTGPGAKTLVAVIADDQARWSNASISLTVLPPFRAIHDIQGAGTLSPYEGQQVKTSGIVTGIKAGGGGGFFIQVPDADADGSPATSEGIFVFTGPSLPAAAAVGNSVAVTGLIQEFVSSSDPWSPPATEIAGIPSVTLLSTGNPLPAPVTLTAADTNPAGALEQLERFEGMRVHVDSLTVVAPTEGNVAEASATASSNGIFFGVITGVARPFREPGIQLPDPLPLGAPCCVPRFDANPELIRVDSDGQPGAAPIDVTSGATVTGLTGPLDYSSRAYTLLPDPATPPTASGNVSATPVPVPAAGQFTIASFNMERFFDTTNDAGSDVPLTPTAFNNRLNKVSLAIRTVMRTPDIIGVQEVENLTTLQAIANKVNSDAVAAGEPDPQYNAYLVEGNDIGGIDVGFLVKHARVSVIDVTQYGDATTYIDPNTGLPELLNDRPPLVLRAEIQPPSGSALPITVIDNHLRSLNGVDDPVDGNRVRTKRAAQAEFLANLIQARQSANANERIISVGDYNAFQFNDGYADVIGTVRGAPTPATKVVKASTDLVNPDLLDLVELAPAAQRYSYVFGGSAQELDHLLITGNLLSRFSTLNYARNDADFPETYRNDPNRPERLSDHDMPVAYFAFPAADLSIVKSAAVNPVLTGSVLSYTIAVENSLTDAANSVVVSDQVPVGTYFVSMTGPSGWTCGVPDPGGIVSCSTPSLAAGGTATLTLKVEVACGLANATPIANTATVTSSTYDPDASNNTSTAAITASNPAPIVVAPADATYQCVSQVPPANTASASVSDNCGVPAVSVVESNNGGAGTPASPLVITRTFTAVDSAGGIGSATQTITVLDNTPPVIAGLSVDQAVLWPPNHKMQPVTLTYTVSDGCSTPTVVVSVSSNEPVNGTGDGDTAPDWQVLDSRHVLLRAERAGNGVGRVYTIHVTATDAAGNMTVADVTVSVPHNR